MSEDVNHSVVGGGRGVVQARSCGGGGDARHCSVIIVARVAADEYECNLATSFVMVSQRKEGERGKHSHAVLTRGRWYKIRPDFSDEHRIKCG